VKLLLPCIILSGVLNATGFIVEDNTAVAVGALMATIGLTLVVVAWIDKRIAVQIKPLKADLEELKEDLEELKEMMLSAAIREEAKTREPRETD